MKKYLLFAILIITLPGYSQNQELAAESLFEEAIRQQNAGNHVEAISLLTKCVYVKSNYVEAYSARAASKGHLKDLDGALTDLNNCLELAPDQYEVLLSRGSLLFRVGRYADAKTDFLKLLTLPVGETSTVFYRRSAHGEGTDHIMTAQGSSRSHLFNYLGLIEVNLKNSLQGIVYLDSAISINPTDADLYVNRALAKQACNNPSSSDDFQKALELNPDHAIAKHNLAVQSAKQGSFSDAEQKLTNVIESDSTMYYPYVERGYLRLMRGDLTYALNDYEMAIRLNPIDPEVWLNRGYVKEKLHDLKGAFEDYTQAVAIKEDLVKAWLNRGNVLMKMERYEDAIDDYSAAITYQPDYGHAWFNKALAYYKLKRHKEACADLRKAEQLGVTVDTKIRKVICK